jgi:hypothetical protein
MNTWRAYKKYSYINYLIRLLIFFKVYAYIIVYVLNRSYLWLYSKNWNHKCGRGVEGV